MSAPACQIRSMVFAAASSASTIALICSGSQRAEFGHCDQQGKGGDVGDAGNAGQDGEAIGEACVRFDHLENCCFDRRDLPINLFLDKGAY